MESMLVMLTALCAAVKVVNQDVGLGVEEICNRVKAEFADLKDELTYQFDRINSLRSERDELAKDKQSLLDNACELRREINDLRELPRNQPNYDDLPSWRVTIPLPWMNEHKISCIKAYRAAYYNTGLKEAKEIVENKIDNGWQLFTNLLSTREMVDAVKLLTTTSAAHKMSSADGLVIEREWKLEQY